MTIRDVAKYSGVSVSTVSRVLNQHPDVSEAVRARVLEAVQVLHYVPNNSARDLVSPPPDAIGVVVRGMDNPFFTPIITTMEQRVNDAGYTMILRQIPSGDDELLAGASLVRSKKLRGLILLGGSFDYAAEDVASLDVPFACCTYANSFGSLDKGSFSSVTIDDQAEAHRAVKLLIDRGHRRVAALLDSVDDHSISELRYKGYCQALEEAGIPFAPSLVEETGQYDMAAAYTGVCRLLRRTEDFTALFVISDSMAIAAMKALHDHGLTVPERCSVIAIDGLDVSGYTVPTLTTLAQPKEAMGAEAVDILLDILENGAPHRHVRMETTLRSGGSVAPLV